MYTFVLDHIYARSSGRPRACACALCPATAATAAVAAGAEAETPRGAEAEPPPQPEASASGRRLQADPPPPGRNSGREMQSPDRVRYHGWHATRGSPRALNTVQAGNDNNNNEKHMCVYTDIYIYVNIYGSHKSRCSSRGSRKSVGSLSSWLGREMDS